MKVVYNSFGGRYSDNPRAIYEALASEAHDLEHVWLVDPAHRHGFPAGVPTVAYGGAECIAALESADVLVSNTHIELDWTKRPGARYLQTWHGTPLKKIHFDALWARPERLVPLNADIARWDLLLSPNADTTRTTRAAFGYRGEVAETGLPRNDVLSGPRAQQIRARVRRELEIPDDAPVVLYTPTWRDDLVGEGFPLQLDLEAFARRLPDSVLLLRLHYLDSGRLGRLNGRGVRDVSFHPEISELYLAADVLLTDYSSTMFDFAVTGKPIVFFTYDFAHYRDNLRGFYYDFSAVAPGPLLSTSPEVVDALTDLDEVRRTYDGAYSRFRERFCYLEDGRATERVVTRLFGSDRAVDDFALATGGALAGARP